MSRFVPPPLLMLCVVLFAGCSTYDPGALGEAEELTALGTEWSGDKAHPGSILLAPIEVGDLTGPNPRASEKVGPLTFDGSALERALAQSLQLVVQPGQRVGLTPIGQDPKAYALAEGYELILRVEVTRWNALFVETTGWWYPNALFLGWYFWPFGSWTIADEVYGLDCALTWSLQDTASEKYVGQEQQTEEVRRTLELFSGGPPLSRDPTDEEVAHLPRIVLSDGERGLDFFGTWAPGSLDPDQWVEVSLLLEPYALRHTSVRLAAASAKLLSEDRAKGSRAERFATTHAVVVGIGSYGDQPCPGAKADGQAVGDFLRGVSPLTSSSELFKWLPEKNLSQLLGANATVADVYSSALAAAGRARAEDTLVFYFAGKGRFGEGEGLEALELTCSDGPLSLARLRDALEGAAARRRLILLDCDFKGGGSRGEGEGTFPLDSNALKAALLTLLSTQKGLGLVILGSDPTQERERTQSYAFESGQERGLLTTYLVRALSGEA
ncbi:MAG: hypothetical protein JKY65_15220, partial [Planctomycetes bacterium]|nr:hypothetical protein [Planctomycetota bacterium]